MKDILKLIVVGLIVIVAAGMTFAVQNDTVIEWQKPVLACAVPAIIIGYLLRKQFCDIIINGNRWLGGAAGAFATFTILIGAFYTLNYYGADDSSTVRLKAAVMEKHSSERYRTRRSGRGHSVRGDKYLTYSVTVQMPDGRSKMFPVSVSDYTRLRKGDTMSLSTQAGLFGIPVIKDKDFKTSNRQ